MLSRTVTVARVFGIEIRIDISWLLAFGLIL